MVLERLQKVLARGGVASRRRSEEIIAQGRVTVDGKVVTEMGTKVDADSQRICCDGEPVRPREFVYFLLNKPLGAVCSNSDPQGRGLAVDLIPGLPDNVHTIGRLDTDTEGLIIITNDGAFTQRVAHPSHRVRKVYEAWVRGAVRDTTLKGLLAGVMLDGRKCRALDARVLEIRPKATLLSVTVVDGRNREVRRMLKRLNHPVTSLRRVAIGPISDPRLHPGQWRVLRPDELRSLLEKSGSDGKKRRRPPRTATRSRGPRSAATKRKTE